MPQQMSRLVVGILLSTLATASYAGGNATPPAQQLTVQTNQDYWNGQNGSGGFGQRVSERARSEGGPTFTSFGDFLQMMRKQDQE